MKKIRLILIIISATALTAIILFVIDANKHLEKGRIRNIWFLVDTTTRHDTLFIYRETYEPRDNGSSTPEEFRKKLLKDGYVTEFPHSGLDTVIRNDTVIITKTKSHAW